MMPNPVALTQAARFHDGSCWALFAGKTPIMKFKVHSIVTSMLVAAGLAAPVARAEVKEVRFARQLGLGYLQLYVMQAEKLVEKHGKALGLDNLSSSYRPLGSPTALTDALLSDNADIVGIGLPSFLTMWDRNPGLGIRG